MTNRVHKLGPELCYIVQATSDLLIQITKNLATTPFLIHVDFSTRRQGDGGGVDIRHVVFLFVSNVYNLVAAESKQQQALLDQLGARLLHTESLGQVRLAGG